MIKLFPKGLTVAELKSIVQAWPDTDEGGKPNEVWMMTGPGLSSPVIEVATLNQADICLACDVQSFANR